MWACKEVRRDMDLWKKILGVSSLIPQRRHSNLIREEVPIPPGFEADIRMMAQLEG
jgi:hypothetical protein